jgi:hypothetical protein
VHSTVLSESVVPLILILILILIRIWLLLQDCSLSMRLIRKNVYPTGSPIYTG